MGNSIVPQRRDRLVTRVIGGETVVVPLASRPEELTSIFILNAVGAFVWSRLDGRMRLDDLVPQVCQAFEGADEGAVAADVVAFLEELSHLGLVTLEPSASAEASCV